METFKKVLKTYSQNCRTLKAGASGIIFGANIITIISFTALRSVALSVERLLKRRQKSPNEQSVSNRKLSTVKH